MISAVECFGLEWRGSLKPILKAAGIPSGKSFAEAFLREGENCPLGLKCVRAFY
jgi:hypothetical protein